MKHFKIFVGILMAGALGACSHVANAQNNFTLPHDHSSLGQGGTTINATSISLSDNLELEGSAPTLTFDDTDVDYDFYFDTSSSFSLWLDNGSSTNNVIDISMVGPSPFTLNTMTFGSATDRMLYDFYGSLTQYGLTPWLELFETDGTATEQGWRWIANGDALVLETLTDAGVSQDAIFTIDRTGTAPDGITFCEIGDVCAFTFFGDIVQDGAWQDLFFLEGAEPTIQLDDTASAQTWEIFLDSNDLIFELDGTPGLRMDAIGSNVTDFIVGQSGQAMNVDLYGDVTIDDISPTLTITDGTTTTTIDNDFYESGSYTGTTTGCTSNITWTVDYQRIEGFVTLEIYPLNGSNVNCTSNSTSFSLSGTNMPTTIRPASSINSKIPTGEMYNNGGGVLNAYVEVASNGTLDFCNNSVLCTGWTASGAKGLASANHSLVITYSTR